MNEARDHHMRSGGAQHCPLGGIDAGQIVYAKRNRAEGAGTAYNTLK